MFLIGVIIVSIVFSVQPFIKKEIMKDFTIEEYSLIATLINLTITLCNCLYYKNINIKNILQKNNKSTGLIFITALLTSVYGYFLNLLLQNFDVKDTMPFIRCGEMIWIFILTGLFDFSKFSCYKLIGIVFFILGILCNSYI